MEKRKHAIAACSSNRKPKRKPSCLDLHIERCDSNAIFAVLLASLSDLHHPHSLPLINKCLFRIRSTLLSETSVRPFLALFPTLLSSKSSGIACRVAGAVGAASLVSLEVNEEVASDSETLKGLISLFENPDRRVLLSACNAVLDLSTTTFGQHQLLKFSTLEKLMFVFMQIFKCVESVSLWSEGNENFYSLKIGIKGDDELLVGLLSATVILINACEVEQLQNIPRSLSEVCVRRLKEIWAKVSDQVVMKAAVKSHEGGHVWKSNVGVSNLAESIFRLSINDCQLTISLPHELVKGCLFGTSDNSFQEFLSTYWEVSPFLLQRASKDPSMYDMFSPFIESLSWTGCVPSLISSILSSLVSCFPIASDEENIFNFLNEVKDKLGCPLIYQQDIRVVKAEKQSRKEMHYFQDFHPGCLKEHQYFTIDDVLKCGQAYKEGYTVALRGLEFRYKSIAAIAETLALMFGQPSVGANLYLTPPNSQGLACHFDDHCVFVYQIFGCKQWTVFSQPSQLLPRLYDGLHGSESDIDCTKAGRREFILREGDVLYIPRGFPHEAYTNSCAGDGSPGFSLHLTLSIEVEPPFEWEGIAHFALHCWSENHKRPCYDGLSSESQKLDLLSVYLLHVAIGIISNLDPIFRKACLTAAVTLQPDAYDWLVQSQKNIFLLLLDKIRAESRFFEVLDSIEFAIQKNEDPFQQARWLWVHQYKGISNVCNTNKPFIIEDLLLMCDQHKDKLEAAFLSVKSRFCSEVVFEDVVTSHSMLLQKYRKTRKQYINGMVSLHDKW